MLPRIPVKITAMTVTGTIPPRVRHTSAAMGVVTDLGSREAVMEESSPNKRQSRKTLPIEAREPAVQPARIGSQYSFRSRMRV